MRTDIEWPAEATVINNLKNKYTPVCDFLAGYKMWDIASIDNTQAEIEKTMMGNIFRSLTCYISSLNEITAVQCPQ